MTRRLRRDLRQMRHAQDLVALRNRGHFLTDHAADLTADVRIDLVEHEQRNAIEIGQHCFQREHHAGQLTARRHAIQG